jgi:hypothetical protein
MADVTLAQSRIRNGRWQGVIIGAGAEPEIDVLHLDQALPALAVEADPQTTGRWTANVAIPPDLLSDGVQTFVVHDRRTGDKLGSFAIVTGVPLEDDIRAEIDLLRAELDLLKKAFRRHCVETAG